MSYLNISTVGNMIFWLANLTTDELICSINHCRSVCKNCC